MDVKTTIVIVGASFGGLTVAKELISAKSDKFNVVLVDKRDYLDLNFGSPRVLLQPDDAKKLVFPLSTIPWLKRCTFVQAAVRSIERSHIECEDREDLKFDICVICTGSAYSNSFCKGTETLTADERIAQYEEGAARVQAAKSALIIGGGFVSCSLILSQLHAPTPSQLEMLQIFLAATQFRCASLQTGMEMAAEAKEAGVENVTMVHSKDFVTNTPEQGRIPLQRLKKIGVNVLLSTKAEHVEDRTYLIAGEQQTFDVVYKCVGFSTVHAALVTPLGNVLTPSGAIDVNASFQVKGYSNIFAIGDAVDVDDDHLAYQAMNHGKAVGKAILKLTANPNSKLPQWKRNGGFRMALLVLGPKNVLALVGARKCFTYVPGSANAFKLQSTQKQLGV